MYRVTHKIEKTVGRKVRKIHYVAEKTLIIQKVNDLIQQIVVEWVKEPHRNLHSDFQSSRPQRHRTSAPGSKNMHIMLASEPFGLRS